MPYDYAEEKGYRSITRLFKKYMPGYVSKQRREEKESLKALINRNKKFIKGKLPKVE